MNRRQRRSIQQSFKRGARPVPLVETIDEQVKARKREKLLSAGVNNMIGLWNRAALLDEMAKAEMEEIRHEDSEPV